MEISTVVSFCSLEAKFFDALIKETKKFCNDIVVVYYDHFFDGKPENIEIIEKIKEKHSDLNWNALSWSSDLTSKFCHNNARWIGAKKAKHSRVLFVDADEIPDGDLMKKFLEHEPLENHILHVFRCNWYFREPIYLATTTEICGLLVDMDGVTEEMFFTPHERWFFQKFNVKTKMNCTVNRNIIFNHYSWVRTKEEMLTKVSSWAHKNDKPWKELVEEEFSREFNGKDFVHNYQYVYALNIFDIKV